MNSIQVLQNIATVEAGTGTAAWRNLPTARSPAGCQVLATGSQDRMDLEVNLLKPPVTKRISPTKVARGPHLEVIIMCIVLRHDLEAR